MKAQYKSEQMCTALAAPDMAELAHSTEAANGLHVDPLFVRTIWMPTLLKKILSAIDDLRPEPQFELSHRLEAQISETSGLSQPLENQNFAEVSDSQSSQRDLQQITPDTSSQAEKPATKKKKKKKEKNSDNV